MHGLGTLLACAHMVRKMFSSWGTDGEPVFSKGDHEKAYRQWPVCPEDYALLITLVWSDMVGQQEVSKRTPIVLSPLEPWPR